MMKYNNYRGTALNDIAYSCKEEQINSTSHFLAKADYY